MSAYNCNRSLVDDKLTKYGSQAADPGFIRYSRNELFSLRRHSGRPDLDRLASLGLLCYRRHRGGKHARERMTKYRIRIATSSIPPSNHNQNNNKSLGVNSSDSLISDISSTSRNVPDNKTRANNNKQPRLYTGVSDVTTRYDQCPGQPIPVVITNRSGYPTWKKSPAGRSRLGCLGNKDTISSNSGTHTGHKILFINATSLAKPEALSQLQVDMLSLDVDVGLVAETWMKQSKHHDSLFATSGYSLIRQDRSKRKGGGVLAYIKNELKAERITTSRSCSKELYELIWFKCAHLKMSCKFYYCLIYHPPKPLYDSKELINDLISDIEDIAVADPDAIISIIGDLNSLDHSKLEAESGLVQLVHDVTHGKNILDKFLTNNPDLFSVRVASSTIKTKHKSVLANCSTDPAVAANKRGRAIHSFPDIRAQHIALLRETLAAYNWGAVYAAGNDINIYVALFNQTVRQLAYQNNRESYKLNKCAYLMTIRLNITVRQKHLKVIPRLKK